jgi:hypothetical protein
MRTEWTVELSYESKYYPEPEKAIWAVIDEAHEQGEVISSGSGLGLGYRDHDVQCKTDKGCLALFEKLAEVVKGIGKGFDENMISRYSNTYANVTCPCGTVNEVLTEYPNSEYRCEKCTEWLHDDLERT